MVQVYFESHMKVESKLHFQEYEDQSPSKSCCFLSPELGWMVHRTLLSLMHLILYCTTPDKGKLEGKLTGVSEERDGGDPKQAAITDYH